MITYAIMFYVVLSYIVIFLAIKDLWKSIPDYAKDEKDKTTGYVVYILYLIHSPLTLLATILYMVVVSFAERFGIKKVFNTSGDYHNPEGPAKSEWFGLGHKYYYLNGKYYGNQNDFTKESWIRFVKLSAFE